MGFRPAVPVVWALLLSGGLLLSGCNGAGSKRASLYQRLVRGGPWTVERLEGPLIDPQRIDRRYEEVRFTFRSGKGGRQYRIVGQFSPDSTEELASGAISLPRDNVLQMVAGFRRRVTWRYKFQVSRAVFDLRVGSRPFLRTFFPQSTWSESQSVEMKLAPDGK